jgi:hypothetical protein
VPASAGARPVLAFLVLAIGLGGCAERQRAAAETAEAKALISDDQEMQLGMQVQQELQKQNVRYLDDPEVTAYVHTITSKIFPLAEKDRPGVKWSVRVIDDSNVVNAFATPGGFLYVYTGLLLAASDRSSPRRSRGSRTTRRPRIASSTSRSTSRAITSAAQAGATRGPRRRSRRDWGRSGRRR